MSLDEVFFFLEEMVVIKGDGVEIFVLERWVLELRDLKIV